MTRAAIIWFVVAAVVGAVAGVLHVLRSDLGGAHTGQALAIAAWGATAVAALMLYHGIMVAASEQDELAQRELLAAPPAPVPAAYDTGVALDDGADLEMVDDDDAYTFRRGREKGSRPRGRQRR